LRHLILVLVIVLSISAAFSAASPKDTLPIKRQLTTYAETFPTALPFNSRLIEWRAFNYDTEVPHIYNSISVHEYEQFYQEEVGFVTDWDYTHTYVYIPTYTYSNGLYHYLYSPDELVSPIELVRDEAYRLIYEESDDSWIRRSFDQTDRLDSLKLQLSGADPLHHNYTCYKLNYAGGNTYADSINGYYYYDNAITNPRTYTLDYGTTLTQHPFPLHMHEVACLSAYTPCGGQMSYYNSPVLADLLLMSAILNPVYQVASYTNITSQTQTITYEQTSSGYEVNAGSVTLTFDSDGYFTGCTKSVYIDPWSGSYVFNVTWDTITANEDEVISAHLLSLSSYPNPFRQDLSIKLSSKDNTPSELNIYNVKGQLIRSWKDVRVDELTWDGKDNANRSVSSGIYIIKARQGKGSSTLKVIKY
jgi:hypothetical protein